MVSLYSLRSLGLYGTTSGTEVLKLLENGIRVKEIECREIAKNTFEYVWLYDDTKELHKALNS